MSSFTIEELEFQLGQRLKALRLNSNFDQIDLAQRAGISVGALKRLEAGAGSSTKTLIAVLRSLGREEWLTSVAPVPTINPLNLPRAAHQRQRASTKPSSKDSNGNTD